MTAKPQPTRLALLLTAALAACGVARLPAQADDAAIAQRFLAAADSIARGVAVPLANRLLREQLFEPEDAARYGLHFDANWEQVAAASPNLPLVVFIHGFNSTAESNVAILAPIRAAGFPVATFAYPNDEDIDDSAALLSQSLKKLAAEHPNQTVSLVTHSMGGLVARACVEDSALDPGNVTRLEMIAPPSQGSLIARVSMGADLWEHWLSRSEGSMWRRFRDSVVDGTGEAAAELMPGSPFLTRLNARHRNPRIKYAIFLGTHSAVTASEINWLRLALAKSARHEGLASYAGSGEKLLDDLDELAEGKGDGVVALKRGRLDGVADIVELPFDHLSCTGDAKDNVAVQQLQSELINRLK
jgi:pimeloyl-ACP methyl ester carboxylesterase